MRGLRSPLGHGAGLPRRAVPAAALLAVFLVCHNPVVLAEPGILSGVVQDPAGHLLEGSVVLLAPVAEPRSARTTSADADGRYLFRQVVPGLYRVAAMKTGYVTTVASVNTVLKSTLDLALRPVDLDEPDTASRAWILRLPPRDLLREHDPDLPEPVAASTPGPTASDPPAESASLLDPLFDPLPVDGEVQQWFSSDSPVSSSDLVSDSSGTATAVKLAVQLGERVNLKVSGERERQDAEIVSGPEPSERLSLADWIDVSLGYDTSRVSRLDMRASYNRQSRHLGTPDAALSSPFDRENVTRLYRTSWRTAVGSQGSLDVSALYMDSEATGPEGSGRIDIDPVVNRLWRAGGQYRTSLGGDHVVTVGLRARMLEVEGPVEDDGTAVPAGLQNPVSLAGPQPPGWALHLHGSEDWALTPSLSLQMGIDYHRSLSSIEVSHLVPQAGASYRPTPQTLVRGKVSYLADSTSGSARPDATLPITSGAAERSRERLGFELAVEGQTKDGTLIVFTSSAQPIAYSYTDESDVVVALAERPLYVSDGQAQSREVGLEVQRRFGWLTARAGSSSGRIEGRYAAALPGEPLGEMREGHLRFVRHSVSGRVEKLGTELRMELRELSEHLLEEAAPDRIRLSGLSVLLAQDLRFIRLGDTRWRLLVAYQSNSASSLPGAEDDSLPVEERTLLMAENRLSGGVSVQF